MSSTSHQQLDIQHQATTLKESRHQLQEAETLRREGDYDRAEAICLSLLQKCPNYFGALHTIGLVYADKERPNDAIRYLVQAAMINPHSWMTLTALAGEYLLQDAKEMASAALQRALEIHPSDPATHVTLGEVSLRQRDYLLAYQSFAKAIELAPDLEEPYLGFAKACNHLGRYEEGSDALHRLLEFKAPTLSIMGQISLLPGTYQRRDLLADLDSIKNEQAPDDLVHQVGDAFIRCYALGQLGRYEEAWQYALKGNQTVAAAAKNEIIMELQSTETRVRWCQEQIGQLKGREISDPNYPTSLFILGPSRSGKTTTESLFSSQEGVTRGYENLAINNAVTTAYQMGGLMSLPSLGQLPEQLYPIVKDVYRKLLGDAALVTNTSPGHIWDTPFFFKAIPNLRCVFVKRNPEDLMLKIFMKYYNEANTFSYDLRALQKYLALYYKMIDLVCEAFPTRCKVIHYDQLVADPKKSLEQMCALCDITPDYSSLPDIPDDRECSAPYRQMMAAEMANSISKL